jgi:hypothetical protein
MKWRSLMFNTPHIEGSRLLHCFFHFKEAIADLVALLFVFFVKPLAAVIAFEVVKKLAFAAEMVSMRPGGA